MTAVRFQYISLDGNSLTSTDLVNLGKGRYKIKVSGISWVSTIVVCNLRMNIFKQYFSMENALQLLSDPSCPQRPSKKLCNRESSWTPL